MVGEDGKSSKGSGPKTIPITSPLYLHPSDNPNLNVTQIFFDGNNYDLWAEAVKNGLDAKNKLAFIEGKVKKPVNSDDEERYAAGNAPHVHQLKTELNECKQGGDSIVEYYTHLKTIWDELANYSKAKDCTCGAAASLLKEREEEKVYQFLMGLDSKLYGNIRSNLLMEDPITTLTRAYALMLKEERHVSLTKVKEERNDAAMAVRHHGTGRGRNTSYKSESEEENKPPKCNYCGKFYHKEEDCYDKHGYEGVKARERGRGRRGGSSGRGGYGRGRGRGRNNYQANAVGGSFGTKDGGSSKQNVPFLDEEIVRLRSFIMASPEGVDKSQGMKFTINVEWLIDSGSSHHMTGRRDILENVWVEDESTVSLPDGRKVTANVHGQDRTSKMNIGRGYPHSKKGWKLYDLQDKRDFVSRDVIFYEHVYPYLFSGNDSLSQHEDEVVLGSNKGENLVFDQCIVDDIPHVVRGSNDESEEVETCELDLAETGTTIGQAMETDDVARNNAEEENDNRNSEVQTEGQNAEVLGRVRYAQSTSHRAFLAKLDENCEPSHYYQAAKDSKWREAMSKEIEALEKNGTWNIVLLPKGKKPIGCKWVYKIKYRADGTVERYKARLVAQGFTQVEGIDFHETYAPVVKMTSVRCLLAVAVIKGWFIEQLDVNNAFLYGDLEEEVYMRVPQGFERKGENKVCKLMKSIYGLKQASRNWFAKLTVSMKKYGFVQSLANYSLFTLNRDGIFIAVLVYVDDMIVVSNDRKECAKFKYFLDEKFGIKDLGKLKYFLGIEVEHGKEGLFLNQRKYAVSIVEETGMKGAKTACTPIQQRHGLALARGYVLKDVMKYRRLVGRLVYLTITRPGLVYAVHILSQFMNEPRKEHWEAGLRVVRYIKRNPSKGISFKKNSEFQIKGYCDSDYASCPLTRRSLSGYFVALGGIPISWRVKKQNTVALSTAEAEYRAMAKLASELVWIKSFMASLGVFHTQPMKVFCDNQAAIHIARNPVFHDRTKHIEIDCHFCTSVFGVKSY
ncbi:uncharacterized protein LOC141590293 [Silene latifolia]|uniref:uncharacterized protein LOC141590293 n=1 Tax=Silene latifolia TaxID=37657 RepID=UPI003D789941